MKHLIENHKQYDFFCSKEYNELFNELKEAYDEMDVELGIEILGDIKQAEIDFKDKLPWWYTARWDFSLPIDVQKEALRIYEQNIYKKEK